MNNYERLMKKVKDAGVPVTTSIQKKMKLYPWQIDMLESFKTVKKAHFILTLSKNRPVGEMTSIRISYNGQRLIPLK